MTDAGDECRCEFDYRIDDDPDEEPWHYTRTCPMCGCVWGSLHCEHDGIQNPCPDCEFRAPGSQTAIEALGIAAAPGETLPPSTVDLIHPGPPLDLPAETIALIRDLMRGPGRSRPIVTEGWTTRSIDEPPRP